MTVETPQILSRAASETEEGKQSGRVLYDQFILFGDSITQGDGNPELSFSCYQALQHGEGRCLHLSHCALLVKVTDTHRSDYIRRVDIVNRGFRYYIALRMLVLISGSDMYSAATIRLMRFRYFATSFQHQRRLVCV